MNAAPFQETTVEICSVLLLLSFYVCVHHSRALGGILSICESHITEESRGLESVTRASVDIVMSGGWVGFQFWANSPFNPHFTCLDTPLMRCEAY